MHITTYDSLLQSCNKQQLTKHIKALDDSNTLALVSDYLFHHNLRLFLFINNIILDESMQTGRSRTQSSSSGGLALENKAPERLPSSSLYPQVTA